MQLKAICVLHVPGETVETNTQVFVEVFGSQIEKNGT